MIHVKVWILLLGLPVLNSFEQKLTENNSTKEETKDVLKLHQSLLSNFKPGASTGRHTAQTDSQRKLLPLACKELLSCKTNRKQPACGKQG